MDKLKPSGESFDISKWEVWEAYRQVNAYVMRWIRNKYKRLPTTKKAKSCWQRITRPTSPALRPLGMGARFLVDRMTRAR